MDAKDLKLFEPTLMAINSNSIIFIFDNFNSKITSFMFLNNNKIKWIEVLDTKLKDYNDMTVDEDTNQIYLVKCIDRPKIKLINRLEKRIETLKLPAEISSGMSVIEYTTPTQALNAVLMFNNQVLNNRTMNVRFDTKPPGKDDDGFQQSSSKLPSIY